MQKSTQRSASRKKYDIIKNFPDHISNYQSSPGFLGLWKP